LPFVIVLALSGLAMLASEPLDRYIHSELLHVTHAGTALSASAQVAAVASAYPDADIATFTAGLAADESVPISIVPAHAGASHGAAHVASEIITVYVDACTGALL